MVLAFLKVIGLAFLAGPAAFAEPEHRAVATSTEPEHNVHNRDWSTTSFSGSDSSLITVYAVSSFSVTTTKTETNSSFTKTTTYTYSDQMDSFITTLTVNPSPTPPVTPYSQGNCNLHLTQWTDASAINKPHSFEVTMWDNDKQRQIGYAKATGFGGGDPFIVESKLEDKLVVTQIYSENLQPEYIRFILGAQTWASTDKLNHGIPGCNLGDWDGSNNPSYRQMDCSYICIWGGGKASDGS